MDKAIEVSRNQYSEIKLVDRKKISLSGVRKLVSFNPEEFLIETNLGVLLLKGSGLEILKLDTLEGVLAIKGKIDNLDYMDGNKKSEGIIAKLFK